MDHPQARPRAPGPGSSPRTDAAGHRPRRTAPRSSRRRPPGRYGALLGERLPGSCRRPREAEFGEQPPPDLEVARARRLEAIDCRAQVDDAPPAPHDQQRQCVCVTVHDGCRSSCSGVGQDTRPLGGTTMPATASKYTSGGTALSGSSRCENATWAGLVDVASVDRRRGWWQPAPRLVHDRPVAAPGAVGLEHPPVELVHRLDAAAGVAPQVVPAGVLGVRRQRDFEQREPDRTRKERPAVLQILEARRVR